MNQHHEGWRGSLPSLHEGVGFKKVGQVDGAWTMRLDLGAGAS